MIFSFSGKRGRKGDQRMLKDELFQAATAGFGEIPTDWMPATAVRSFFFDDPAVVWLDYYGEQNGFKCDESPYDFLNFIGAKGRQFEEKWIRELATGAVVVCREGYEVRSAKKVRETIENIYAKTPIIARPALWWAPERIYGVPDLIVHTSWIEKTFPALVTRYEREQIAGNLGQGDDPGHYIVLDIKFTTKLEESEKKRDLGSYAAQVRIYSFMVGHFQGLMPRNSYLVTRDHLL